MESLPWIELNSLVNARKQQDHDVAAESTSGLSGGQSGTTLAIESCLSFQVNRSGKLNVSREQTAASEAASETCVASFHSLSEECYPFLLSPLDYLVYFSFPSSCYSTLGFILSSAVGLAPQENCHLELLI